MAIDSRSFGPLVGRTITHPITARAAQYLYEHGVPSFSDMGASVSKAISDFDASSAWTLAGPALGIAGAVTDNPIAKGVLSSAGYGLSAVANPFMAAWGLPQFANSLYTLFNGGVDEHDSGEALLRRAHRTRDAASLEGQTARGLMAGDLNAPVANSTVGDTLARILEYQGNGTWALDTSHNWWPDPFLEPARRALKGRGYGATEPTVGDVGGVGEMVMGGGLRLIDPSKREAMNNAYTGRYGYAPTADTPEGELIQPYYANTGESPYLSGVQSWHTGLRRLFGVPDSAPNPWDFHKPVTYHADPMGDGQIPDASPALDYQKFLTAGGAERSNPENTFVQYLDTLDAELAAKMRAGALNTYNRGLALNESINNPGG
jgi:hypothetical protein